MHFGKGDDIFVFSVLAARAGLWACELDGADVKTIITCIGRPKRGDVNDYSVNNP